MYIYCRKMRLLNREEAWGVHRTFLRVKEPKRRGARSAHNKSLNNTLFISRDDVTVFSDWPGKQSKRPALVRLKSMDDM